MILFFNEAWEQCKKQNLFEWICDAGYGSMFTCHIEITSTKYIQRDKSCK